MGFRRTRNICNIVITLDITKKKLQRGDFSRDTIDVEGAKFSHRLWEYERLKYQDIERIYNYSVSQPAVLQELFI